MSSHGYYVEFYGIDLGYPDNLIDLAINNTEEYLRQAYGIIELPKMLKADIYGDFVLGEVGVMIYVNSTYRSTENGMPEAQASINPALYHKDFEKVIKITEQKFDVKWHEKECYG